MIYTGHLKWYQCLGFSWTSVLEYNEFRVSLRRLYNHGVALIESFAVLMAYGYRFGEIASGHLLLTWIIEVLAISQRWWMRISALPF